jgi:hypothetical protein
MISLLQTDKQPAESTVITTIGILTRLVNMKVTVAITIDEITIVTYSTFILFIVIN